jgi:hypothetical protein
LVGSFCIFKPRKSLTLRVNRWFSGRAWHPCPSCPSVVELHFPSSRRRETT